MLGFAQGEYDVLLSTTIIESGLDIPNVNTIIIDRGDAMGLAQLYQLRGRVGRGANRAYAYLFYKEPLSDIARQRLQTIQEATELGAGFRVAMRDLEIRGAGEILGPSSTGTSPRSVLTSTPGCCKRRWRSCAPRAETPWRLCAGRSTPWPPRGRSKRG